MEIDNIRKIRRARSMRNQLRNTCENSTIRMPLFGKGLRVEIAEEDIGKFYGFTRRNKLDRDVSRNDTNGKLSGEIQL
jgi:hypothetical protein